MERSQLRKRIFARHSESSFLELALEIFQYQFENNSFYRSFVEGCKVDPKKVKELNEIPFLPVDLQVARRQEVFRQNILSEILNCMKNLL